MERLRVLSNYLRMAVTVVLSLWLVRIFVHLSPGVYAVVVLVATSSGLAGMLKEMVRGTMIPELGLAYHGKDREGFATVYSSAFVLSAIAGLFGVIVLALVYWSLNSFSIAPELAGGAGALLLTRMVSTFVSILLAPAQNLLPVTGRNGLHNTYQAIERAAELAAVLLAILIAGSSHAEVLVQFAWISMVTLSAVSVAWAIHGGLAPGFPRFGLVKAGALRGIAKTIGWNGFVVASFNLFMRFDVFFMNIYFGIAGTFAFGLASQLLSYSRQLTMGLVQGFDASVARLVSKGGATSRDARLALAKMDGLQALTIFASSAFLVLNAPAIFRFWLGSAVAADEAVLQQIVTTFQLMVPGIVARSLSEGWMKYLSGAGAVRRYAPYLLIGALLNPPLVLLLAYALPGPAAFYCAAIAFSALMMLSQLVVLPVVLARALGEGVLQVFRPFAMPLVVVATGVAANLAAWQLTDFNVHADLAMSALAIGLASGPVFLRKLLRL